MAIRPINIEIITTFKMRYKLLSYIIKEVIRVKDQRSKIPSNRN